MSDARALTSAEVRRSPPAEARGAALASVTVTSSVTSSGLIAYPLGLRRASARRSPSRRGAALGSVTAPIAEVASWLSRSRNSCGVGRHERAEFLGDASKGENATNRNTADEEEAVGEQRITKVFPDDEFADTSSTVISTPKITYKFRKVFPDNEFADTSSVISTPKITINSVIALPRPSHRREKERDYVIALPTAARKKKT
ncbi:MAG: hypothetical protein BJ554DRAFT_2543 [Olpidium bornovanus]|uniref:Uncharacterized protein n=1 Tax=Olpidium bornovanus TaxID=278681 RepID=A0A8H7ZQA7_9FUNG|nr:MAG: hypothetical protein BJ554DRAFT_2543 [Olpidium bornovanus]